MPKTHWYLSIVTLHHDVKTAQSVSTHATRCASGCVVVPDLQSGGAGSNLGRGYFTPRSTQPSIPPGSVNEYQLRLGRQRQVWLIPIADERVGVQVKLWDSLRTRAIPERFCGGVSLRRRAISSVCTFTFNRIYGRMSVMIHGPLYGSASYCIIQSGATFTYLWKYKDWFCSLAQGGPQELSRVSGRWSTLVYTGQSCWSSILCMRTSVDQVLYW